MSGSGVAAKGHGLLAINENKIFWAVPLKHVQSGAISLSPAFDMPTGSARLLVHPINNGTALATAMTCAGGSAAPPAGYVHVTASLLSSNALAASRHSHDTAEAQRIQRDFAVASAAAKAAAADVPSDADGERPVSPVPTASVTPAAQFTLDDVMRNAAAVAQATTAISGTTALFSIPSSEALAVGDDVAPFSEAVKVGAGWVTVPSTADGSIVADSGLLILTVSSSGNALPNATAVAPVDGAAKACRVKATDDPLAVGSITAAPAVAPVGLAIASARTPVWWSGLSRLASSGVLDVLTAVSPRMALCASTVAEVASGGAVIDLASVVAVARAAVKAAVDGDVISSKAVGDATDGAVSVLMSSLQGNFHGQARVVVEATAVASDACVAACAKNVAVCEQINEPIERLVEQALGTMVVVTTTSGGRASSALAALAAGAMLVEVESFALMIAPCGAVTAVTSTPCGGLFVHAAISQREATQAGVAGVLAREKVDYAVHSEASAAKGADSMLMLEIEAASKDFVVTYADDTTVAAEVKADGVEDGVGAEIAHAVEAMKVADVKLPALPDGSIFDITPPTADPSTDEPAVATSSAFAGTGGFGWPGRLVNSARVRSGVNALAKAMDLQDAGTDDSPHVPLSAVISNLTQAVNAVAAKRARGATPEAALDVVRTFVSTHSQHAWAVPPALMLRLVTAAIGTLPADDAAHVAKHAPAAVVESSSDTKAGSWAEDEDDVVAATSAPAPLPSPLVWLMQNAPVFLNAGFSSPLSPAKGVLGAQKRYRLAAWQSYTVAASGVIGAFEDLEAGVAKDAVKGMREQSRVTASPIDDVATATKPRYTCVCAPHGTGKTVTLIAAVRSFLAAAATAARRTSSHAAGNDPTATVVKKTSQRVRGVALFIQPTADAAIRVLTDITYSLSGITHHTAILTSAFDPQSPPEELTSFALPESGNLGVIVATPAGLLDAIATAPSLPLWEDIGLVVYDDVGLDASTGTSAPSMTGDATCAAAASATLPLPTPSRPAGAAALAAALAILPKPARAVMAAVAPHTVTSDVAELLDVLRASSKRAQAEVVVLPPHEATPAGTVDVTKEAASLGVVAPATPPTLYHVADPAGGPLVAVSSFTLAAADDVLSTLGSAAPCEKAGPLTLLDTLPPAPAAALVDIVEALARAIPVDKHAAVGLQRLRVDERFGNMTVDASAIDAHAAPSVSHLKTLPTCPTLGDIEAWHKEVAAAAVKAVGMGLGGAVYKALLGKLLPADTEAANASTATLAAALKKSGALAAPTCSSASRLAEMVIQSLQDATATSALPALIVVDDELAAESVARALYMAAASTPAIATAGTRSLIVKRMLEESVGLCAPGSVFLRVMKDSDGVEGEKYTKLRQAVLGNNLATLVGPSTHLFGPSSQFKTVIFASLPPSAPSTAASTAQQMAPCPLQGALVRAAAGFDAARRGACGTRVVVLNSSIDALLHALRPRPAVVQVTPIAQSLLRPSLLLAAASRKTSFISRWLSTSDMLVPGSAELVRGASRCAVAMYESLGLLKRTTGSHYALTVAGTIAEQLDGPFPRFVAVALAVWLTSDKLAGDFAAEGEGAAAIMTKLVGSIGSLAAPVPAAASASKTVAPLPSGLAHAITRVQATARRAADDAAHIDTQLFPLVLSAIAPLPLLHSSHGTPAKPYGACADVLAALSEASTDAAKKDDSHRGMASPSPLATAAKRLCMSTAAATVAASRAVAALRVLQPHLLNALPVEQRVAAADAEVPSSFAGAVAEASGQLLPARSHVLDTTSTRAAATPAAAMYVDNYETLTAAAEARRKGPLSESMSASVKGVLEGIEAALHGRASVNPLTYFHQRVPLAIAQVIAVVGGSAVLTATAEHPPILTRGDLELLKAALDAVKQLGIALQHDQSALNKLVSEAKELRLPPQADGPQFVRQMVALVASIAHLEPLSAADAAAPQDEPPVEDDSRKQKGSLASLCSSAVSALPLFEANIPTPISSKAVVELKGKKSTTPLSFNSALRDYVTFRSRFDKIVSSGLTPMELVKAYYVRAMMQPTLVYTHPQRQWEPAVLTSDVPLRRADVSLSDGLRTFAANFEGSRGKPEGRADPRAEALLAPLQGKDKRPHIAALFEVPRGMLGAILRLQGYTLISSHPIMDHSSPASVPLILLVSLAVVPSSACVVHLNGRAAGIVLDAEASSRFVRVVAVQSQRVSDLARQQLVQHIFGGLVGSSRDAVVIGPFTERSSRSALEREGPAARSSFVPSDFVDVHARHIELVESKPTRTGGAVEQSAADFGGVDSGIAAARAMDLSSCVRERICFKGVGWRVGDRPGDVEVRVVDKQQRGERIERADRAQTATVVSYKRGATDVLVPAGFTAVMGLLRKQSDEEASARRAERRAEADRVNARLLASAGVRSAAAASATPAAKEGTGFATLMRDAEGAGDAHEEHDLEPGSDKKVEAQVAAKTWELAVVTARDLGEALTKGQTYTSAAAYFDAAAKTSAVATKIEKAVSAAVDAGAKVCIGARHASPAATDVSLAVMKASLCSSLASAALAGNAAAAGALARLSGVALSASKSRRRGAAAPTPLLSENVVCAGVASAIARAASQSRTATAAYPIMGPRHAASLPPSVLAAHIGEAFKSPLPALQAASPDPQVHPVYVEGLFRCLYAADLDASPPNIAAPSVAIAAAGAGVGVVAAPEEMASAAANAAAARVDVVEVPAGSAPMTGVLSALWRVVRSGVAAAEGLASYERKDVTAAVDAAVGGLLRVCGRTNLSHFEEGAAGVRTTAVAVVRTFTLAPKLKGSGEVSELTKALLGAESGPVIPPNTLSKVPARLGVQPHVVSDAGVFGALFGATGVPASPLDAPAVEKKKKEKKERPKTVDAAAALGADAAAVAAEAEKSLEEALAGSKLLKKRTKASGKSAAEIAKEAAAGEGKKRTKKTSSLQSPTAAGIKKEMAKVQKERQKAANAQAH